MVDHTYAVYRGDDKIYDNLRYVDTLPKFCRLGHDIIAKYFGIEDEYDPNYEISARPWKFDRLVFVKPNGFNVIIPDNDVYSIVMTD